MLNDLDFTDVTNITTRSTPAGGVAFTFTCRDVRGRKTHDVTVRFNAMMLKELRGLAHESLNEIRGTLIREAGDNVVDMGVVDVSERFSG